MLNPESSLYKRIRLLPFLLNNNTETVLFEFTNSLVSDLDEHKKSASVLFRYIKCVQYDQTQYISTVITKIMVCVIRHTNSVIIINKLMNSKKNKHDT